MLGALPSVDTMPSTIIGSGPPVHIRAWVRRRDLSRSAVRSGARVGWRRGFFFESAFDNVVHPCSHITLSPCASLGAIYICADPKGIGSWGAYLRYCSRLLFKFRSPRIPHRCYMTIRSISAIGDAVGHLRHANLVTLRSKIRLYPPPRYRILEFAMS